MPDSADLPMLRDAVQHQCGVPARHSGAVDVHGLFPDLPWSGIVSVFDLLGHPTARTAYAWRYGQEPTDIAIYISGPPIRTAVDAVRAWLTTLAK